MRRGEIFLRDVGGRKRLHVACYACGTAVRQRRTWQRFCSQECRTTYHNKTAAAERRAWKESRDDELPIVTPKTIESEE